MITLLYALIIILPAFAIMTSAFVTMKKHFEGRNVKKSIRMNLATFAIVAVAVCTMTVSVSAVEADTANAAETAQTQVQEEAEEEKDSSKGLGLLAAGLVTGLAGIGGGIAVAAGAPAAIAATSENPKAFGKSIIFVALGESIALYGVVISILILNKI
ncbi:MAG: hypothetical protein J6L89_01425 [Clostridia bacterium]|nr:hypothetical protein [Clostridia bacterium]